MAASANKYGENDEKTLKWKAAVNTATASLNTMERQLAENTAELDKQGKSFDSLKGKLSDFGSKAGSAVAVAAKASAAAIGAASAAIVALGKIGLDYNTQMETYTTNFGVMLGDQEAAIDKVEELKKFASSTPFAMEDLAEGTQTLLAFNVSSEDSTGILKQLGDIALGDSDKLGRLTTAFGKANSTGKLTGETMQQMIEAGFNPALVITQKTGESMAEFQKRLSAGAVGVDELKGAMDTATSTGGQFYQGMEQASKTTAGLMSTLKDNATALVGEVFQPVSEGLLGEVLPAAITAISDLTSAYSENGIDGMIEAGGNIVGEAIASFTDALPQFIETASQIVQSLVKGIKDNLDQIIEGAATTVDTLVDGIIDMLPDIIQTGILLIGKLAAGLIEAIPDLVAKIPEILAAIIDGFSAAMPDIIDIGKNIVSGIWEGTKACSLDSREGERLCRWDRGRREGRAGY